MAPHQPGRFRPDGKRLLCVDLSYQVYRAAAAHPMLSCREVFTGGLYGFLVTLAKTIRETHATHIAFCRDLKPYVRSKTYPEYKLLRKAKQDDELKERHAESMVLVLEFLEAMSLPVWGIPGFESDDLIAHAALKYRHRFRRIYAASNDSDLYQLLWIPNVCVYTKDAASIVTAYDLEQRWQITPEQFMLATALQGTHNDIAGIPKVGEITARKAVKDPALLRKLRADHAAIIDRNLKLITLPHPEFPAETRLPEYRGGFDQRLLYRFLARYEIDATASMVAGFEQLEPQE